MTTPNHTLGKAYSIPEIEAKSDPELRLYAARALLDLVVLSVSHEENSEPPPEDVPTGKLLSLDQSHIGNPGQLSRACALRNQIAHPESGYARASKARFPQASAAIIQAIRDLLPHASSNLRRAANPTVNPRPGKATPSSNRNRSKAAAPRARRSTPGIPVERNGRFFFKPIAMVSVVILAGTLPQSLQETPSLSLSSASHGKMASGLQPIAPQPSIRTLPAPGQKPRH